MARTMILVAIGVGLVVTGLVVGTPWLAVLGGVALVPGGIAGYFQLDYRLAGGRFPDQVASALRPREDSLSLDRSVVADSTWSGVTSDGQPLKIVGYAAGRELVVSMPYCKDAPRYPWWQLEAGSGTWTGDETFDAAVRASVSEDAYEGRLWRWKDIPWLAALLSEDRRAAIATAIGPRTASRGFRITIEPNSVRAAAQFDDVEWPRTLDAMIAALSDLVEVLSGLDGASVTAELLDRAEHDPLETVRAWAAAMLIERFPDSPECESLMRFVDELPLDGVARMHVAQRRSVEALRGDQPATTGGPQDLA